jgi:hypothetical protein
LPPGQYFRLLLVGYFEGLDAERGIAWQAAVLGGSKRLPHPTGIRLPRLATRIEKPIEFGALFWRKVAGKNGIRLTPGSGPACERQTFDHHQRRHHDPAMRTDKHSDQRQIVVRATGLLGQPGRSTPESLTPNVVNPYSLITSTACSRRVWSRSA